MNNDAYKAAQRMKQADQMAKMGGQMAAAGCIMFILPVLAVVTLVGILAIALGG